MEKLSASLEDYLEIICNYSNNNKQVRAVDISKELKISRASVTEALKKLATKGYINYGRYDAISLTSAGKNIANCVISKHNILQSFFEKFLELDADEASRNACKIEHVITEKAFQKISQYVENKVK